MKADVEKYFIFERIAAFPYQIIDFDQLSLDLSPFPFTFFFKCCSNGHEFIPSLVSPSVGVFVGTWKASCEMQIKVFPRITQPLAQPFFRGVVRINTTSHKTTT